MNTYYENELIKLYHGECLEIMDRLIDQKIKVDVIITDIPYGTTACKWDTIIPFDEMWERIIALRKDNTPILLFGTEPFSSNLRLSNIKEYKYDWIWEKSRPSNFQLAKKQPMRYTENVSVFYKKQPNYYPIKVKGDKNHRTKVCKGINNIIGDDGSGKQWKNTSDMKYPSNIVKVKSTDSTKNYHPTQKPVDLMEYLINTYTNENDLILDFTCGSGTTLVAAQKLNRKCIGIELEEKYCEATKERLLDIV